MRLPFWIFQHALERDSNRSEQGKTENLGESATFVNFRSHLQDTLNHHREEASSWFNQTSLKNLALGSLPYLLLTFPNPKRPELYLAGSTWVVNGRKWPVFGHSMLAESLKASHKDKHFPQNGTQIIDSLKNSSLRAPVKSKLSS